MHSPLINKQADKFIAVFILILLVTLAYVFFQNIYIEQISSMQQEIELRKKKNAKVNSILVNEVDLQIKIDQQKKVMRKDKLFLNSKSSATAASELQNYLKRLIATHSNGKIQTIKPYPVIEKEDYSEISLEIRVRDLTHKGLQNVLYHIENNSPVILVKELDVKRKQLRYKPLVKKAGKATSGLETTFSVSGYFRESGA